MAISIKKLTIWRSEIDNRPGALGAMLEPIARAGHDLEVLMGYEKPGDHARSIIEVAPLATSRARQVATEVGLVPSEIPCLLVEGTNRVGLGHDVTRSLGDAGINIQFLVTLVTGRKYRAIMGFGAEANLKEATGVIKNAAEAKKKAKKAQKKAAKKKSKGRAKTKGGKAGRKKTKAKTRAKRKVR